MKKNSVSTHDFARGLLGRRDEYVRFWVFGRLSIVWDSGKPVERVGFDELRRGN